MRELKFNCVHCGWEITVKEGDIVDECSLCGHEMILDDESLDELIAEDLEETELITMQHNIKENGNDKVWYDIEKAIDNPYFRVEYRRQFFKAGGYVPTKEIRI